MTFEREKMMKHDRRRGFCGSNDGSRSATRPLLRFLAVLLTIWGGNLAAWAQATYTYKVYNAEGTQVAEAVTNSTTLEVPQEIKAASCRFRYYDTAAKAQAMNPDNELTALPGEDATIYVGYRSSMRIFPNATTGNWGRLGEYTFRRKLTETTANLLVLGYENGQLVHYNNENWNTDSYAWQFDGDPYRATIKNKSTGTYIHVNADKTVELSATPSYFMILYNANKTTNYSLNSYDYNFRLNDEVSTTKVYLRRNNASGAVLQAAEDTPGDNTHRYGLISSSYYMTNPCIYDTYGNRVILRTDGNYKKDEYWQDPNVSLASYWANFNAITSRFVARENAFYATNPQTDQNAVKLERIPYRDDPAMYMKYTPRLKDESVAGILTSTFVPKGSCQDLDLTGATKYVIKFTRGAGRYLYNDGTGVAKYVGEAKSDEVGAQWTLLGKDPYHIIIKSQKDGKVLSLPNLSITMGETSCTITGNSTDDVRLTDLDETGNPQHVGQCFALLTFPDKYDYLVVQGANNNPAALNAYDNNAAEGRMLADQSKGVWEDQQSAYEVVLIPVSDAYMFHMSYRKLGDSEDTELSYMEKDANPGDAITLPDGWKRKYCTYHYWTDAAHTQEITDGKFPETHGNIYVTYETSMPFETSTPEADAKWYRMKVNDTYAYYTKTGNAIYDTDAAGFKTTEEYQWAFVGDPYSMKIVNRKRGFGYCASTNEVTSNSQVSIDSQTNNLWEIVDNDAHADETGVFSFRLSGTDSYFSLTPNDNNRRVNLRATNGDQEAVTLTKMRDYTFSLTEHVNTDKTWETTVSGVVGEAITIPAYLYRRYCDYTYRQNDADVTTYPDADGDIIVSYTTTRLPFVTGTGVSDATWYRMKLGSWYTRFDTTSEDSPNVGVALDAFVMENDYQWAFIGDPYSLQIINRHKGNGYYAQRNSSNSFVNTTTGSDENSKWEIIDNVSDAADEVFALRSYGSLDGTASYLSLQSENGRLQTNADNTAATTAVQLTRIQDYQLNLREHLQVPDGSGGMLERKLWSATVQGMPGEAINLKYHDDFYRKYCTYTFYTSDPEAGAATAITQYPETANAAIWVNYEVDTELLPFRYSHLDDYENAYWYRLAMDGKYYRNQIEENYGCFATSQETTPGTGNSRLFALFGDPYTTWIVNQHEGKELFMGPPAGKNVNEPTYKLYVHERKAETTWQIVDCTQPTHKGDDTGFALRWYHDPVYYWKSATTPIVLAQKDTDAKIPAWITLNLLPEMYEITYRIYDENNRETPVVESVEDNAFTRGSLITSAQYPDGFPSSLKRGLCSYTFYTSKDDMTSGTNGRTTLADYQSEDRELDIYVTFHVENPELFSASTDKEDVKWNFLRITVGTPSYCMSAFPDQSYVRPMSQKEQKVADYYLWALVGNPYELYIVNKGKGLGYRFSADTQTEAAEQTVSMYTATELAENTNYSALWTLPVYDDVGGSNFYLRLIGTEKNVNRELVGGWNNQSVFTVTNSKNMVTVEPKADLTYYIYRETESDGTGAANNLHKKGAPRKAQAVEYETQGVIENVLDLETVLTSETLPEELRRAYCEYTLYESEADLETGNDVDAVTLSARKGTVLYLSYHLTEDCPVTFYDSEDALFNATDKGQAWHFLQMGVGEDGDEGSTSLGEYYGVNDSRTTAAQREAMTAAEKTFVNKNGSYALHFLQRGKGLTTASSSAYGLQHPETGGENVLAMSGNRYFKSIDAVADVELLSPRNDFRRVAETFKDGGDGDFREGRWLWGFVGSPYRFRLVNREACNLSTGVYKYLMTHVPVIDNYGVMTGYAGVNLSDQNEVSRTEHESGWEWELLPTDEGVDQGDFVLQPHEETYNRYTTQRVTTESPNSSIVILTSTPTATDGKKQSTVKAYPWNWSDNKYKTVTVNIRNAKGQLMLTKTYRPEDRAFMAGDVVDGTDGHFLLPHKGDDNYTDEAASDYHYLNIPYEIRRHFCHYTVESTSTHTETINGKRAFVVQDSDDEQVLNISYTVDTPENGNVFTPRFVEESEFDKFVGMKSDTETFKTITDSKGKKVSLTRDAYYTFLNFGATLSHFAHVQNDPQWGGDSYTVADSPKRFQLDDANKLKWFFVGDPYKMRVYNVYTSFVQTEGHNANPNKMLARNKNKGNETLSDNNDRQYYNKAFMQDKEMFYWEMVDAAPFTPLSDNGNTCHIYKEENDNVAFRIDKLRDDTYGPLAFALRMKQDDVANDNDGNGGTRTGIGSYFYLSDSKRRTDGDYDLTGAPIYNYNNEQLNTRGSKLANATLTFPDSYHQANYNLLTKGSCVITALPYAQVYLTVYDHENVNKIVTDMERSDFYVQTERFRGVPNNLQRQFCEYTWVGNVNDFTTKNVVPTNLSDPASSTNNILTGKYVEMSSTQNHLFATYRETDDSPFSHIGEDGRPQLNRTAAGASAWHNMSIGGAWAFFNSNLIGRKYGEGSGDVVSDVVNDHVLSLKERSLTKDSSSDDSWPFYKGLHWALLGDPYRFTLLCQRDRILNGGAQNSDGNYDYEAAYIAESDDASMLALGGIDRAVEWTLMRNGTTSDVAAEYFLSQADTRKTEVGRTGKYAYDYTFGDYSAEHSYNVFRSSSNTQYNKEGNNYSIGNTVRLQMETTADNECFDAIVNVYNKMNELVATTGWTELPRNNATWSGELPTDIKRWGCDYQYWGDETMTLYPFKNYNQKIGDDYLIKDGGIVYVNYSYDESLYSSENEYRWMNPFFNWDVERKVWNAVTDSVYWYTAEMWSWNTATEKYECSESVIHKQKATYYPNKGQTLYTETRQRWMESPETDLTTNYRGKDGTFSKDRAWAYAPTQYEGDETQEKSQKWALIGDPYRFILYNYHRYVDAQKEERNSYYLYYDDVSKEIKNVDFKDLDDRATKQGIYWTWKISNSTYRFGQANDAENPTATTWTVPEGLPESMYKKDQANNTVLQTGYLALCDMDAKSLYDATKLVGAVKGYATFSRDGLKEVRDNSKEELKVTYGNKLKYYGYINQENENAWVNNEEEAKRYPNSPEEATWTINYQSDTQYDHYDDWRKMFGTTDEHGCYQGPSAENYDTHAEKITKPNIKPYTDDRKLTLANTKYSIGDWEGDEYRIDISGGMEHEKTVVTYAKKQVDAPVEEDTKYLVLTGGPTGSDGALNLGKSGLTADRFLVMPMKSVAGSITFHLDVTGHSDSKRDFAADPVYDYTSKNYGVGNTLVLPWMMRREYCDYTYYVVDDNGAAPDDNGNIDDLRYGEGAGGHNIGNLAKNDKTRAGNAEYQSLWKDGQDKGTALKANKAGHVEVPEDWKNKHVYISVTYEPKEEFKQIRTTEDATDAANVNWMELQTQGRDKVMRYTRSGSVMANRGEQGIHTTNDYLWAVEGDPYGFYLHNRYATHWLNEPVTDGDGNATYRVNKTWDQMLSTDIVNTREVYNYSDDNNDNFDHQDENGNYSKRAGIEVTKDRHAAGANDNKATMGASNGNALYEAMMGNYSGAMAIHPVKAPINVKNQNGYKFYSAFLFNAASDDNPDFPVQLNYLQDYYAMSNVFCNWRFKTVSAARFLPYFDRSGYVGGLKPEVARDNQTLFDKLRDGSYDDNDIKTAQRLIDNPQNLVALESGGLYRLKAYSADQSGMDGQYVSGYLNKKELEGDGTALHLYSRPDFSGTLADLEYNDSNPWAAGFEQSADVPSTESDPSTVFRITRDDDGYLMLETQGLFVSGNKMVEPKKSPDDDMRIEAQDIGQTAFQLRTKASADSNSEVNFLGCKPGTMRYAVNDSAEEMDIDNGIHETKWLLQPVGAQSNALAEDETDYWHDMPMSLQLTTGADGETKYKTLYLPYDVLLPEGVTAYVGTAQPVAKNGEDRKWTMTLNAVSSVTGRMADGETTNVYGDYAGKQNFVPAGTPVIVKSTGEATDITMTPTGTVSPSAYDYIETLGYEAATRFEGQYLTGCLPTERQEAMAAKTPREVVYVFSASGPGFYLNYNRNPEKGNAVDNNYLLHNRLFYVGPSTIATGATSKGIEFVFGDGWDEQRPTDIDAPELPVLNENATTQGDGAVYDLQGRKLAERGQWTVSQGHLLTPAGQLPRGVYIVNGKKIIIK